MIIPTFVTILAATVSYETGNITMHMEIVKMSIIYRLSTCEEERKHMASIHFLSFFPSSM
jgi:hypothetical protein